MGQEWKQPATSLVRLASKNHAGSDQMHGPAMYQRFLFIYWNSLEGVRSRCFDIRFFAQGIVMNYIFSTVQISENLYVTGLYQE